MDNCVKKQTHQRKIYSIFRSAAMIHPPWLDWSAVWSSLSRFHNESLEEKLESLEAEDLMSHLSRPENYRDVRGLNSHARCAPQT